MLIKSVSYDQSEIIKSILMLYTKENKIDCDPTYSKGYFYKNTGIKEPEYKFDINPLSEEVVYANAEKLPLLSNSINCLMFDPPFLATTGRSLESKSKNNIINKRFGTYPNENALHIFYRNAIKEFHRVLKDDGILIFKCQDKVSSGKQYFSHCFIYEHAIKAGFYPIDLYILIANNRIVANWQKKNQKHSRKFHCYFWVLKKCNTHIEYVKKV